MLPARSLVGYPSGTQAIVHRERPHPGAQLDAFEEADGWRYTAFATDTRIAQLAHLDVRHRAHARVEDRIRTAKDTGPGRFPSRSFAINAAWLTVVIHALRLAREAANNLLGARLLSNLSHQANYLGAFTHAVQLAPAAQSTATSRGRTSSTALAMLTSMEARALASLGDQSGCARALARAEKAMERNNPGEDPAWINYFDRAELAGESAHCFRDLRRPSETGDFSELALPEGAPSRTRAFINMVGATAALHAGHLDEAIETARAAVVLADSLRSSRYQIYVRDFITAAVQLHPRDGRVVDLVAFTEPVVTERRAG